MNQAQRDAKIVGKFLLKVRDHFIAYANGRISKGDFMGAVQYGSLANATQDVRNSIMAWNGAGFVDNLNVRLELPDDGAEVVETPVAEEVTA